MNWTEEQLQAIMEEGSNIIVSAGAGSGKTAVLSERVLRKVKDGAHVDEMLILTFTNAAAKEMKGRIRKKLIASDLLDEVVRLDKAYITTFDAFALATVKKYHAVLNISREISICDSVFLDLKIEKILNDIFDDYYVEEEEDFSQFIFSFCTKDDKILREGVLKLYHKLEMRYDVSDYLENYINDYYNDTYISSKIEEYICLLKEQLEKVSSLLGLLSCALDYEEFSKYHFLSLLVNACCYDEMVEHFTTSLPRVNKNYSEEAKEIKSKLSDTLKALKPYFIYESEEQIREEILSTKPSVCVIISILQELRKRVELCKKEEELYTFTDIFKLAIFLVEKYPTVRKDISESFCEIMIDEYQDNNDLQEIFIDFIAHDNVYMVGDIKQSIYRFRNANPNIFKSKYELYSKTNKGKKIDLNRNFRSRSEVLDDINTLFSDLMDIDIGGADYKTSHQMIFGNQIYCTKGASSENYHLEILKYEKDARKNISIEEEEIFIICQDIKKKIDSGFFVFDNQLNTVRPIRYSDIVVLLDKSKYFDLYKKIFEYFGIPLSVYKDESLKSDTDIFVLNHILKLIYKVKDQCFDTSFRYSFLSVARSYLFRLSDDEIFSCFTNNSFQDSIVYKKILSLLPFIDSESPLSFYHRILDIFQIEEKMITTQNVKASRIRLEYFYNMLKDLVDKGYTIRDFSNYLDTLYEGDYDLKFSLNKEEEDSCKIMTIHKSKGLEYPLCYFASFTSEFNLRDLNERFLYDVDYQIVIPSVIDGIKPTIYKQLLKTKVLKEEIGEKIRLLYVALTRSREKMIMVIPDQDSIPKEKTFHRSFYDMMCYVLEHFQDYIRPVESHVGKEYLKMKEIQKIDFCKNAKIEVCELDLKEKVMKQEKFSKDTLQLMDKKAQQLLDFGTKVHEVLEFMDFKNPNYEGMDSFISTKVKAFLETDMIKSHQNSKFYHEYEFVLQDGELIRHGIIDLLIESEDEIIIIDYKLKNVDDVHYREQLEGYRKALSMRTDKSIFCYLYSITDCKFFSVFSS